MLGKIFRVSIAAAGLMAATSIYVAPAEAAFCAYSGGTSTVANTGDVEHSTDCYGPEAGNDSPKPATLNATGAFGGGWEFLAKKEWPNDGTGFDFNILEGDPKWGLTINPTEPNNSSGTWAVNGGELSGMEFVLLFKTGRVSVPDGCDNDCELDGNGWVAYLFDGTAFAGDYDLSWITSGNTKLSHVSLYGRGGGSEAPEPAALGILGLGLVGLGIARRRRQKK